MERPAYCYVGGKSAGHILPAMRLAQRRSYEERAYNVHISTRGTLDNHLVSQAEHIDEHIPLRVEGSSRYRVVRYVQQLLFCFWALIQSIRTIQRVFPERVIVTGGLISLPVSIAAWLLHIPLDVYELNVRPGMAVYYISYIADITYICFSTTQIYMPHRAATCFTQYPLAEQMYRPCSQAEARHALGIPYDKQVVLVLGGSQGSAFINRIMAEVVTYVDVDNTVFIHQTGYQSVAQVQQTYREHGIQAVVFSFREDMHIIYHAADCCIARAGAGTLFELIHMKLPAYIIPLEVSSTQHQQDNAKAAAHEYPEQFWVQRQIDVTGVDIASFIATYTQHVPVHIQQEHEGGQQRPYHRS